MNECRIVLIEDNPGDVFLVELALKEKKVSCEITTFGNGHEALKVLCSSDSQDRADFLVPDVILMDLNTPKCDGFEVLVRLRGSPRLMDVPVGHPDLLCGRRG